MERIILLEAARRKILGAWFHVARECVGNERCTGAPDAFAGTVVEVSLCVYSFVVCPFAVAGHVPEVARCRRSYCCDFWRISMTFYF